MLLGKRKYPKIKTDQKLSESCFVYVNSSHRVTGCPCRSLSLRLFLWNLQSEISEPIEGYDEKGNIFH